MTDKPPCVLDADGCVTVHEGIGIGIGPAIDTEFIDSHPLIEGPCYV